MTAPPTRSVRAMVAGLVSLAVVAVGCAGEPAAGDAQRRTGAPDIDQPDDANDDARDSTPASSSPTLTNGTPRAANPEPQPASTAPAAKPAGLADGHHAGRLVSITTADVTVELVRILAGDEAIAAARADGGAALDDDGTLPNDIHVQSLDLVVTIPVAGDGGFRVYDCSGGCQIVGTTLTALASGEVVPSGGPNAVINLTVDQGVVVSFEEQYLP